jgi:hypothetical protein
MAANTPTEAKPMFNEFKISPPAKTEEKKDLLNTVIDEAKNKSKPAAKRIAIEEDESDDDDKNLSKEETEKRIGAVKAEGNEFFKKNSMVEAAGKFSEAISLYKKNE